MYQAFDILFDDPTHNPNPDGVPLSWQQQSERDRQVEKRAAIIEHADRLAEALKLVLGGRDSRVEVTPAVAIRWARLHGAVNDFDPSEYEQLIRKIDQIIGRMSHDNHVAADGTVWPNANNGTPAYTLHIGTEGSEVLYVRSERTSWANGPTYGKPVPFTAQQVAMLEYAAERAGAEEYWANEGCTEFRIWWD